MEKQSTLDGSEYVEPIKPRIVPKNLHCFICMDEITTDDYTIAPVKADFCHSSYWEGGTSKTKLYGKLNEDGKSGVLYICKECNAEDDYGNPMGEGYEWCNDCGNIFNSQDMSMSIYEASGDILCTECAHDYVKEHIEDFLNEGMPNLEDGPIPSVNLGEEDITDVPNLVRAPEDTQGWCSSIDPVHTTDYGRGTWMDALKAVVARKHKWLILTTTTNNCCSLSIEVYEYKPKKHKVSKRKP
jgi:hypothetical protein